MARVLAMRCNSEPSEPATTLNSHEGALTAAVLSALGRLHLNDKEIAALLGMPASQFSRQKAQRDNNFLQLQKLDRLPEAFAGLVLEELARCLGVTVATPQTQLKAIADATKALAAAMEQMAVFGQQPLPFHERRKEVRHA